MDKAIIRKIKDLFENILNRNPEYKQDIKTLYSYIFLEDYQGAYDCLIELLLKFSHKDDLKDIKKDIDEILLDLICSDANNVAFSF